MDDGQHFEAPPHTCSADGQPRRVGVELEMAGIRPEQVAEAVTRVVGGQVEVDSAFVSTVRDTRLGDFRIELDAELLKSRQYQEILAEFGIEVGAGAEREQLETVLSRVAGLIVPLELVGPPVPWTDLETLDAIRQRLHRAGARGTQSSAFYAFGMQLNIEAARLDADYLLAIVRAFVLSYDDLIAVEGIDLSRRITPYIQPFPEEYVQHILQPGYRPDIARLIDDYLRLTPTRNRPLDLLPLFAHIDEDRVMSAPVETRLVNPRPAFHYRLPDCRIDDPGWSLALAWDHWVAIERLAADSVRLDRQRKRRLHDASPFRRWLSALWRRLRT